MTETSCERCKHQNKAEEEHPCSVCANNYTDKFEPETNYDRIRAMSVEEMAYIISKSGNCEEYCVFAKDEMCNAIGSDESICIDGCKQWLLQEVSENDR